MPTITLRLSVDPDIAVEQAMVRAHREQLQARLETSSPGLTIADCLAHAYAADTFAEMIESCGQVYGDRAVDHVRDSTGADTAYVSEIVTSALIAFAAVGRTRPSLDEVVRLSERAVMWAMGAQHARDGAGRRSQGRAGAA